MRFAILSPDNRAPYYSSNATSIVLHLQANTRSILFTGDIDETRIAQLLRAEIGEVDILELPHHGQWSEEAQRLLDTKLPKAVIQSTNKSRHAKDRWTIPVDTVRFVTAIDGNITTTISPGGNVTISGSNAPATMAPCVFNK
jgi:beta-lactamase superfamily II metal-dependent hydrolase